MRKREESGKLHKRERSQEETSPEKYQDPYYCSSVHAMELKPPEDTTCSPYQILIDNLLEGIIIIDTKGIIQYCNQTCLHLLGYHSPAELVHLHISTCITEEYLPFFEKDQQQVCLGRGCFFTPYQVQKKDGSLIWIDGLSCMINYEQQTATVLFIRDVTKQQTTTLKLEKLEKKYRTIAELSANGIITLDPLGSIIYVNKSFTNMIQKPEEQLLNTLFRDLLTDDDIYVFQQLLLTVRKRQETMDNVELHLSITPHKQNPIELSIAPVFEQKEFTGYICTIQDIKERKKFEEEIKKSERLKTEFMNIAAHELKSPVTPIKGYLELIISDEETPEKIKKWAGVSLRNAKRILYLVDDILDVSRLDNDSMKFEMRKIDISELFSEIIEDMMPLITEKQLTFTQEISEQIPPVLGDYHRLSQVLRNLFTNAIKFTDEGLISVHAYHQENMVVFKLSDTGIGMRKDEAAHIFNKFYQTVTSDDRKHEGTGLGLFISREIVKKHHGDITVQSILGKGSTFTVTLPSL